MNMNNIQSQGLSNLLPALRLRRGLVFGVIIVSALLAFEAFNYSTTDYALTDVLGDLKFAGIRWATILSIAFCGIDFAGIARLFTPEQGEQEPTEVWYLFGAWLLAATMNAMLTWWGVSLAVMNHNTLGNEVVAREYMVKIVPVFVAVMVWLIRVLIIGTFSVAGERMFSQADSRASVRSPIKNHSLPYPSTTAARSLGSRVVVPAPVSHTSPVAPTQRTALKSSHNSEREPASTELTYTPLSVNAAPRAKNNMVGYNSPRSFASRGGNQNHTQ